MQTEKQKQEVIQSFPFPTGLAQTAKNATLLGEAMADLCGDSDWTPEKLLEAFQLVAQTLDWLTTAPEKIQITVVSKPAPAKLRYAGSFVEKLAAAGVRTSQHPDHHDREAERNRIDKKYASERNHKQLQSQRHELIAARDEATNRAEFYDNGRINHGETQRARAEALAQIQSQIDNFNSQVDEDLRIN